MIPTNSSIYFFYLLYEKIATGCQDGLVRIYDTCAPEKTPREYKVSTDGPSGSPVKVIWCNESEPMILIVGKKDGVIEKYDTRQSDTNACCKVEISKSKTTIMDMEYKPDQNMLMVACDDKVHALSCTDLSFIKEFTMPKGMHFREEGGVSLHPDGSKFIAGASDLWLREFDFHSGDVLQTLKGHHGPIRCVRYHPNGMYGASGSEDATIRLWELSSVEED
jgi:serine-threonine kinase receptor-associated protein